MLTRITLAVTTAAVLAACSTGQPTQPNDSFPTYNAATDDNSAVVVDSFHWSGIPASVADPLRYCDNEINNGDPATFEPCLKAAYTFTLSGGAISDSTLPADSSITYSTETGKLTLKLGSARLFLMVFSRDGGAWTPVYDYEDNNGSGWNTSSSYNFVVPVWDSTDKYNQSVNHRGVEVPFSWSEVIPQVLKRKQ